MTMARSDVVSGAGMTVVSHGEHAERVGAEGCSAFTMTIRGCCVCGWRYRDGDPHRDRKPKSLTSERWRRVRRGDYGRR